MNWFSLNIHYHDQIKAYKTLVKSKASIYSLLALVSAQETPLYVFAITEIGLFGLPKFSDKEAEQIEAILRTLAVIPVDSRIARTAGLIRRTYRIYIADSAIAAKALFTGSTLLTRNIRDFRKTPSLLLLEIWFTNSKNLYLYLRLI